MRLTRVVHSAVPDAHSIVFVQTGGNRDRALGDVPSLVFTNCVDNLSQSDADSLDATHRTRMSIIRAISVPRLRFRHESEACEGW